MDSINYAPLFLIMAIAWLVPVLLANIKVIKIPSVIVEILCGFIIGANVLDIVPENNYTNFLSKTGFLFLLFMSGLSINVDQIINSLPRFPLKRKELLSNSLIGAFVIYFLSLAISFATVPILSSIESIGDPVFIAIILPTVALSIIVPVLKEQGDVNKKIGQLIMLAGAVSTIMSILLVSFYSGLIKQGLNAELLLFTVIFFTFFVSIYLGKVLLRIETFKRLLFQLQHASSQIKVRGTLFLMLFFVLIAHLIHVELVLGAFLAGIVLSIYLSKERSALLIKLDGMTYGFFVPIFFIMIGVNLDLSALANFESSFSFLFLLLFLVGLGQILPTLLFSSIYGFKESLNAGIVLCSRLGLTIATAQIGLDLGVITPAMNAALVVVSVVFSLLSPLLYTILHEKTEFVSSKIVLVGASRVAMLIADRLGLHGHESVIVELNKQKAKEIKAKGYRVIQGSGYNKAVFDKINLQADNYVIIHTGSEARNVAIARFLRKQLGHKKIITHVIQDQYIDEIKRLDISDLDYRKMLASAIENMIFRPTAYDALFENYGKYNLQEIIVSNKSAINKKVSELPFHKEGSLVVLKRGNETLIPNGDTQIKKGDVYTVIGNEEAIEDFRVKLV